MIGGIELLRLYQRKTSDGDVYFVGTLGDAAVTVIRDPLKRDVWRVLAHDLSRANTRESPPPARALAAPADCTVIDDVSDAEDADAFDELPADL